MKKMSEVFELPLKRGVDDSALEANGAYVGDFWTGAQAVYAIHAINHVDELADVIENVLHHHGHALSCEIKSWCVDALSSYRGKK